MNNLHYYKEVLNNIGLDSRNNVIQGSIAVWAIALISLILLGISYRYIKRKKFTDQPKRLKNSRKKRKSRERESSNGLSIKDKYIITTIALLLVFIASQIVLYIGYHHRITQIKQDIAGEEFETYTGTFSVNYVSRWYYSDSWNNTNITGNVMLSDQFILNSPDYKIYDMYNKKDIYSDYTHITRGSYHGTIIYGKNSKYVVYWDAQ